MTNKKMLKPIPTVTPPQTSRVCRQGCYRQVMPSSERTPPAVQRYDPGSGQVFRRDLERLGRYRFSPGEPA